MVIEALTVNNAMFKKPLLNINLNELHVYLNLFLQCSQQKQDLWYFFLSTMRASIG